MRLIDADALSAEVDKSKYHNPHPQITLRMNHTNEHDHFIKMIYDAPTVDAVEVVRCKDCKHRKEKICFNPCYGMWVGVELKDNDFCSYGERRKDNG